MLVLVLNEDCSDYLTATVPLCHKYIACECLEEREAVIFQATSLLQTVRVETGNHSRPYTVYMLDSLIGMMSQDHSRNRTTASAGIATLNSIGA
jgi:hypothetical protein